MAVKVVMLTSMAGQDLSLLCDDVYETDEAEAARFIEHRAAREYDAELDKNKPIKRRPDVTAELPEGHYQNDKPKGKSKSKKSVETSADPVIDPVIESEEAGIESDDQPVDSDSVENASAAQAESDSEEPAVAPKPTTRRRR